MAKSVTHNAAMQGHLIPLRLEHACLLKEIHSTMYKRFRNWLIIAMVAALSPTIYAQQAPTPQAFQLGTPVRFSADDHPGSISGHGTIHNTQYVLDYTGSAKVALNFTLTNIAPKLQDRMNFTFYLKAGDLVQAYGDWDLGATSPGISKSLTLTPATSPRPIDAPFYIVIESHENIEIDMELLATIQGSTPTPTATPTPTNPISLSLWDNSSTNELIPDGRIRLFSTLAGGSLANGVYFRVRGIHSEGNGKAIPVGSVGRNGFGTIYEALPTEVDSDTYDWAFGRNSDSDLPTTPFQLDFQPTEPGSYEFTLQAESFLVTSLNNPQGLAATPNSDPIIVFIPNVEPATPTPTPAPTDEIRPVITFTPTPTPERLPTYAVTVDTSTATPTPTPEPEIIVSLHMEADQSSLVPGGYIQLLCKVESTPLATISTLTLPLQIQANDALIMQSTELLNGFALISPIQPVSPNIWQVRLARPMASANDPAIADITTPIDVFRVRFGLGTAGLYEFMLGNENLMVGNSVNPAGYSEVYPGPLVRIETTDNVKAIISLASNNPHPQEGDEITIRGDIIGPAGTGINALSATLFDIPPDLIEFFDIASPASFLTTGTTYDPASGSLTLDLHWFAGVGEPTLPIHIFDLIYKVTGPNAANPNGPVTLEWGDTSFNIRNANNPNGIPDATHGAPLVIHLSSVPPTPTATPTAILPKTPTPTPTPAPPASLWGFVINNNTGQAVADARIAVGNLSTHSRNNGSYSKAITQGVHDIVCYRVGYELFVNTITVDQITQRYDIGLLPTSRPDMSFDIDLLPDAPTTRDNVFVRVMADNSDNRDFSRIRWELNSQPFPQNDDRGMLSHILTRKSDRWRVTVTGEDGGSGVSTDVSRDFTIGNTPPSLRSVSIKAAPKKESDKAYFDAPLQAVPFGFRDYDGDEPLYLFRWFVNDNLDFETNSDVIDPRFNPGDVVTVEAVPEDGSAQGIGQTSDPVLILGRPVQVRDVSASTNRVGEILVSWENDTAPEDIAGYIVYRSRKSDRRFVRISSFLVSGESYLDTQVINMIPYFYRIRSVGVGGYLSEYSQAAPGLAVSSTAPSFFLEPIDSVLDAAAGEDTDFVINVLPRNGYTGSVLLQSVQSPVDSTTEYRPNPARVGYGVLGTLSLRDYAPLGEATLRIMGSTDSLFSIVELPVNVSNPPGGDFELTFSISNDSITLGQSVKAYGTLFPRTAGETIIIAGVSLDDKLRAVGGTGFFMSTTTDERGKYRLKFKPESAGRFRLTAARLQGGIRRNETAPLFLTILNRASQLSIALTANSQPLAKSYVDVAGARSDKQTYNDATLSFTMKESDGLVTIFEEIPFPTSEYRVSLPLNVPGKTEIVASWSSAGNDSLGAESPPLRFAVGSSMKAAQKGLDPGYGLMLIGPDGAAPEFVISKFLTASADTVLKGKRYNALWRSTVAAGSGLNELRTALSTASTYVDAVRPFTLIAVTETDGAAIKLGDGSSLSAANLLTELNTLGVNTPLRIIIEPNDCGPLVQALAGEDRVVIGSAESGDNHMGAQGQISFLGFLLTHLQSGENLRDGFLRAQDDLARAQGFVIAQQAVIAPVADTPGFDLRTMYLGLSDGSNDQLPPDLTDVFSPLVVAPTESALLSAHAADDVTISQVLAITTGPGGATHTYQLQPDISDPTYFSATIAENWDIGILQTVIVAEDGEGNLSTPQQSTITVLVELLPADINQDGWVNHEDLLDFSRIWQTDDSRGDLDENGIVERHDLLILINAL
jgi:hypothetical protein